MSEPRIHYMSWDTDDGHSGEEYRSPIYVGMTGGGEQNQLRLTMVRSSAADYLECTVRIPDMLQVEAGHPPRFAFISGDWIMLQDDGISEHTMRECGYKELEPEGLAMKFLRLAWACAHDEITKKQRHGV